MPQPEGKELERVRARRAELREKYLKPAAGRPRLRLRVASRSTRPIRVSSHYPFWLANSRLEFDRAAAAGYRLDLGREFRELFCCWNTGRPYGKTFDPNYVENGLRRLRIYRELQAVAAAAR